jgi:hypothetical protein
VEKRIGILKIIWFFNFLILYLIKIKKYGI